MYRRSRITAVPREKEVIFSVISGFWDDKVEESAVGMITAIVVMIINEDSVSTTVGLNRNTFLPHEADRRQKPRTNNISDRMLPIMTDCAIAIRPLARAIMPAVNSTQFPKVALIKLAATTPTPSDNLSDAAETKAESGMIARKLKISTKRAFQWRAPAKMPSGRHRSRRWTLAPYARDLWAW